MAVSFKGAHFPPGHQAHVRALGRGLPLEYASCGRTDASTWGPRGPRDSHPLGREVQAAARSGVPFPHTPGRAPLADG